MSIAVASVQPEFEGVMPARLNLVQDRQAGLFDGAWWPRSRSLQVEIPSLDLAVRELTGARIARVAYTMSLWAPAPRKLWTSLGMTKLGWFAGGRRLASLDLSLTDNTTLILTVIPSDTDPSLAQQLLADGGQSVLTTPAMTAIERALDRWDDEGGHAAPGPHAEPARPASGPAPIAADREKGSVGQARPEPDTDERAFAQALADLQDLANGAMGGVEGLDRASCSPNIKYLAEIGMGAAARGCSQEGWRAQVAITQGLDATRELDQAEACMRASGLWPWA